MWSEWAVISLYANNMDSICIVIYINAMKCFQRGQAVKLDADDREWIDLGRHPEACLTQPDTCGKSGGALSMWIKVARDYSGGIITTKQNKGSYRGFTVNTVVSRHIM